MEDAEKFEDWLTKMLSDAKRDLKLTDGTIAYILLREGTAYYFKDLGAKKLAEDKKTPP